MKSRIAVAALSFLGMVDTLYLSLARGQGTVQCHITHGCDDVLTSVYSELAGIPISWFGFAFYVTAFSASVLDAFGSATVFRLLRWPATGAFLVSAILTGIQALVLEAYCQYCLTSAGLSTTICAVVWFGSRNSVLDSEEPAGADVDEDQKL